MSEPVGILEITEEALTLADNWPDIEFVLLHWLAPLLPQLAADVGIVFDPDDVSAAYPYEYDTEASHVGTVTPSNLQVRLPFVRVGLVGGQDDRVTDYSIVDIEVFAARRTHARDMAESIRQGIVRRYLRVDTPSGLIVLDGAATQVKPYALPWDDPGIDRWFGTYNFSARR